MEVLKMTKFEKTEQSIKMTLNICLDLIDGKPLPEKLDNKEYKEHMKKILNSTYGLSVEGLKFREERGRGRKRKELDMEKVEGMKKLGLSNKKIGEAFGVSETTIRRRLKELEKEEEKEPIKENDIVEKKLSEMTVEEIREKQKQSSAFNKNDDLM